VSLFYLLLQDAPPCVFVFIILTSLSVFSLHLFINRTRSLFPTFQEMIFNNIFGIHTEFHNSILILGLAIVLLIFPCTIIFTLMSHRIQQFLICSPIIFLFGFIFVSIAHLKKIGLTNRLWIRVYHRFDPYIANIVKKEQKSKLVRYIIGIKYLLRWMYFTALILALWGMADMLFLFGTNIIYSYPNIFLIIPTVIKFSISFLLYIGAYLMMIAPLKKIKFWKNVMLKT